MVKLDFFKACAKMNLNAEDEMIFSEYISDIDSYMADSIENHKIQLLFINYLLNILMT